MPTRSGNRYTIRDDRAPQTTASDDQKAPSSTDASVFSSPESRLEESASEFELSSTERRSVRREEYLASDYENRENSSYDSSSESEEEDAKSVLKKKIIFVDSDSEVSEDEDDAEWKEGCKDTGFEKDADLYTNGKENTSCSKSENEFSGDDFSDDEVEWYTSNRRKRNLNRKTTCNERPKLSTRKDVQLRPQLTTEQKLQELAKIVESGDDYVSLNQFLVCLLWDFDFRYTLLHHQYQGVLAVAGVDSAHMCKELEKLSDDEKEKLFGLGEDSVEFRREFCVNNMKLVASKGILLADDMVRIYIIVLIIHNILV